MWPKWTVRRPPPIPGSGRSQRLDIGVARGAGGEPEREEATGGERPWPLVHGRLLLLFLLYRDRAAAFALAGVLPGAGVVGGLAAALALALVLAAAAVVGHGGAAALALAGVLPAAAGVAGLAAAVALTRVHALTRVLFLRIRLLLVGGQPRSGRHAGHHGAHDLRELSPIHARSPWDTWYVPWSPERVRGRAYSRFRKTSPRTIHRMGQAFGILPSRAPCQGRHRTPRAGPL